MELNLAQRFFDVGVATVILALFGIAIYIVWNNGWKAYHQHFVAPRLEAERKAKLEAEREAERQAAERAGEIRALELLAKNGFELEARDQEAYLPMAVDGEPDPAKVKAEFIVRKGETRFVAEVKSGSLATSTRNGHTRRQLLEYSLLFPVNGVLLVDVTAQRVHEVLFPRYTMTLEASDENQAKLKPEAAKPAAPQAQGKQEAKPTAIKGDTAKPAETKPQDSNWLLWSLAAGFALGCGTCVALLRLAWPYLTRPP